MSSHAVLGRGQMSVGANVWLPFFIDPFDLSYMKWVIQTNVLIE